MLKILFITPQLPFPPHSGGTIKSYKLVEYFSSTYELSVATLIKGDDVNYIDEFKKKIKVLKIICDEINVPRSSISFLKSILLFIPLNVYRNKSKKFLNEILNIVEKYDIIFVDHFLMFQYIPSNYSGKIVLHQHNAEYVMWDRLSRIEESFFKKIILKFEAYRIKKYEKKICDKSDSILAAPNDIEALLALGGQSGKFFETFHLGSEDYLANSDLQFDKAENSLMYVGTLSWEANVDGLVWFIVEAWGELKQKIPDLKFYIIGKNPDNRLIKVANLNQDIILTGFVDDLEEYYQKCKVLVAPLRFGSGMKVKVLSAMSRGIPIVTTSVGAEGIEAVDMVHLAISDSSREMTEKIIALVEKRVLWEKLSQESRSLSREKYTWSAVFENVSRAIYG